MIERDLAGLKGLMTLGILDGHGINGHEVSNFCKGIVPSILSHLIEGANGYDLAYSNNKIINRRN